MFDREIYISRRQELKRIMRRGLVLLFGNNEAPYNYPANTYTPFRQDSSFLYFFGLHRDGLVGIIDIDNDKDIILGDDVDIEDIVWLGSAGSVSSLAQRVGVATTAPLRTLSSYINQAKTKKQKIHFLPPYRHDTQLLISDILSLHPSVQREEASLTLIAAIVTLRSTKSEAEIDAIDTACDVGYAMHTCALSLCQPGVTEKFIGGQIDGIALSLAQGVSFPTICTQHGEIMHGMPFNTPLDAGRLLLVDAGCELNDYCSDHTRTMPVNGHFSTRQRDIYNIVLECHDHVLNIARPGVKWFDIHLEICRLMVTRLIELGLMHGDATEAVAAGAHALFMPHGLGHMLGMDVHDMEGLGQTYVGFDDETPPRLDQFGTSALRLGRRLQKGFVLSDEPGIYFIPALIDQWQAQGLYSEFISYDKLKPYRDFGGIRIEDDLLITDNGCRFLGHKRIPSTINDIENFMATHTEK